MEASGAEPPGAGSACELDLAAPACSAPTCTAPPLGHLEVGETAGSPAGPLNTVPKKRFVVLYSGPPGHKKSLHRCDATVARCPRRMLRQAVFPVGCWADLSLNADGAADISAGGTCLATPVRRAASISKQRICKQSRLRSITRGWTTPSVTTSRWSSRSISATGRERRWRSRGGKFTRAHAPAHTPACGPGILEARRAGGVRSLCTHRRTSRLARRIARGWGARSSPTEGTHAAPRRYRTVLTPLPANDNTAARQLCYTITMHTTHARTHHASKQLL